MVLLFILLFFLRSCCCYVQSGIIIRDFYQETVVFIIFTIAATLYFILFFFLWRRPFLVPAISCTWRGRVSADNPFPFFSIVVPICEHKRSINRVVAAHTYPRGGGGLNVWASAAIGEWVGGKNHSISCHRHVSEWNNSFIAKYKNFDSLTIRRPFVLGLILPSPLRRMKSKAARKEENYCHYLPF